MDAHGFDDGLGHGAPLLRLREDPNLWGKVAALWHRERARAEYLTAGFEGPEARRRANDEALDIARSHGFRGDAYDLKGELADLLAHRRPAGRRGSTRYWEDEVDQAMVHLLAADPQDLQAALRDYLLDEVTRHGPFCGKVGLYKLAYIIGFVPPFERLAQRNAFIAALSEIAHHRECCEAGLFNVVFRLSRPYTLKSYEERLGAGAARDVAAGKRRGSRWLPSWLRSHD